MQEQSKAGQYSGRCCRHGELPRLLPQAAVVHRWLRMPLLPSAAALSRAHGVKTAAQFHNALACAEMGTLLERQYVLRQGCEACLRALSQRAPSQLPSPWSFLGVLTLMNAIQ